MRRNSLAVKSLPCASATAAKPIPCTVKRLEDGRLLVRFLSEASAIAPGTVCRVLRWPACGWRLIHRFPTGHRDVYCRK